MQKYDESGGPPDLISNLYNLLHYKHGDAGETPYALSPRSRLQMCLDVACAMEHLSGKGFMHLDLASFNVLVWKDGASGSVRCKLADFSFALNMRSVSSSLTRTGAVGGPPSRSSVPMPTSRAAWKAPELVSAKPSEPSQQTEVYGFGMIVYEVLTGRVPYEGIEDLAVAQLVQDDGSREAQLQMPDERLVLPSNADAPTRQQFKCLVDLMRQCLKTQPLERPTFSDIVLQLQQIAEAQPVRARARCGCCA